jgi:hypothetical protein
MHSRPLYLNFRVSAYAQISADLTRQIECVLFDQHQEQLVQFKKEQFKKDEEVKLKDAAIASENATKCAEIMKLTEANSDLTIGLEAAQMGSGFLRVRRNRT